MPQDLFHLYLIYIFLGSGVFHKESTVWFPSHCPYNLSKEPIPGAPIPTCNPYKLSKPEWEVTDPYFIISSWLDSFHIGAVFSFMDDKILRPSNEYRTLIDVTGQMPFQ